MLLHNAFSVLEAELTCSQHDMKRYIIRNINGSKHWINIELNFEKELVEINFFLQLVLGIWQNLIAGTFCLQGSLTIRKHHQKITLS